MQAVQLGIAKKAYDLTEYSIQLSHRAWYISNGKKWYAAGAHQNGWAGCTAVAIGEVPELMEAAPI